MELTWRDVYDRAIDLFGGQRPGTQLEADIVEQFEHHPAAVRDAIEKLGERFKTGRVHSPWPLVLRELERSPDRESIIVSDESERARAVHLAEVWIRNAGLYLADDAELQDALFGPHGPLRAWQEDDPLRARLEQAWRHEHPRGVRADEEMRARAARNAASYHSQHAEPEPSAPDDDIPF